MRRYQKLLPFNNKYGEQFDQLGKYLVSEVRLETGSNASDLGLTGPLNYGQVTQSKN